MLPGKWTVVSHSAGRYGPSPVSTRDQKSVVLPESGEVTVELKLQQGTLVVDFEAVAPSAGAAPPGYAFLLAPGVPAPRSFNELTALFGVAIMGQGAGQPGKFTVRLANPGTYQVVVLSTDGTTQGPAYVVPIEVTAAPKQSILLPAPTTTFPMTQE